MKPVLMRPNKYRLPVRRPVLDFTITPVLNSTQLYSLCQSNFTSTSVSLKLLGYHPAIFFLLVASSFYTYIMKYFHYSLVQPYSLFKAIPVSRTITIRKNSMYNPLSTIFFRWPDGTNLLGKSGVCIFVAVGSFIDTCKYLIHNVPLCRHVPVKWTGGIPHSFCINVFFATVGPSQWNGSATIFLIPLPQCITAESNNQV